MPYGCEVESSESMETHSPDEARRGWRMANHSTEAVPCLMFL